MHNPRMLDEINLPLILAAAFVATASPGPATLAIAGTSMTFGRKYGLALAAGVTTGSWCWSIAAALGVGAVMLSNVWMFELLRYLGACYLLYLAYKSARSALSSDTKAADTIEGSSLRHAYAKGLGLHLTNPKAVLFFGSLFSIGVPVDASLQLLLLVSGAIGVQSLLLFFGYAVLFSSRPMANGYERLRRWFEAAFAVAFGIAGLKILSTKIN